MGVRGEPMTNWRELLDEHESAARERASVESFMGRARAEDRLEAARHAIELALNRAGVMCVACGRDTIRTRFSPRSWYCAACGQPYDAPEGT